MIQEAYKYNNEDAQKMEANFKRRRVPISFASKKPKDLTSLIIRLIFNREATYYVNDKGAKGKPGSMQCSAKRARTIEDCYALSKYYFPEITYQQVHDAIRKVQDERLLHSNFCFTVKREVFRGLNIRPNEDKIKKALHEVNIQFKTTKNGNKNSIRSGINKGSTFTSGGVS